MCWGTKEFGTSIHFFSSNCKVSAQCQDYWKQCWPAAKGTVSEGNTECYQGIRRHNSDSLVMVDMHYAKGLLAVITTPKSLFCSNALMNIPFPVLG